MPIHILEPQVAAQIAAGEVIERPASVVKELIENSIDAGASDIRVEIRQGGRSLIRVQDDGRGIPAAEAPLAFQRHATSKIETLDDLDRLRTLGFRGEALASIAAVAGVTLVSRAREEEVGVVLRMIEGREAAREPRGAPAGTILTVESLFASMPARLKFLKQPATEAGLIQQIVTRYALAYPERRFNLVSDGRLTFQSTGSGKLYDVLVRVYGLETARQMLPVGDVGLSPTGGLSPTADAELPSDDAPPAGDRPRGVRVTGYAGAPALHRSNRGYITLFVNRRWFQDPSLAYGVIQAYHGMLPVGRYPAAVVFIEIDPAEVDVNVHPTKAEVRFRESHAVFGAIQRAVRETLTAHAPIPSFGVPVESGGDAWQGAADWAARREALLGAGRGEFPAGGALEGGRPAVGGVQYPLAPESAADLPPEPPATAPPRVPVLRVVGQLGATYIVAEGPDGMYLIDQHAAHERILYEQMMGQHAGQTLAVQALLEPLVLETTPEQEPWLAAALDALNEWGIAIEPFGAGGYLVRSVPAVLARDDPHAALREVVDGLAGMTDPVAAAREAALVTLICKRAAVKGGQPLALAEMQEMVRQLEACQSPRTCPHGRPTMLYLSAAALARNFERT